MKRNTGSGMRLDQAANTSFDDIEELNYYLF